MEKYIKKPLFIRICLVKLTIFGIKHFENKSKILDNVIAANKIFGVLKFLTDALYRKIMKNIFVNNKF